MFEFITNYFVPKTKESAQIYRTKIGVFEGWVSVLVNGILFVIKLAIGIMVGAVSLIADAVHTLSDVISSGVVIWGFKQAEKPADVEHPYGHGRAEYIATLIIAILLVVAGIEFIQVAIDRIRNPELVSSEWWMVVALGVTILLKEVTARYAEFLSSKIASGTLHADAWHHRSDAISSLLVVIALVAGNFGYPAVDGWAGLGVSLFLIYTGYEIAKEAVDDLIGKPPSSEEVETIRQIVLDVNGVLGAHDIIVHSYGHDKFVSIHVEIDAIKSTGEAHDISEEVESRLEASLGVEPTIHLDPVHPNDPLVQDVMNHLSSITSQDDRVTDFHDIRVVNTENHQVILFGTNMKIGTTQKDIVACNQGLEKSLKEKFNNYEVQIKVSPMHRF
ncbi:MAG: cation transporter [Candidatus Marinimicrobia bacterium]|jgi:cation diffusion facilitator family transporter|nr:cation transporter [Candidatus Neomarinimicrobiota bacterium]MBT3675682.1 cation transporter [Candidatus Neomarinimicrobiota bacterium]MBT3763722.1 cation transporter [Candidatus Neomarinimicrobiota bacterium]MBT4068350.1 cation transporter [Candidatus Neomarinimicrobiota bacterium]MBT4271067.1 cation transporter [Candidatus Neomarinimicrobiota bacterium]